MKLNFIIPFFFSSFMLSACGVLKSPARKARDYEAVRQAVLSTAPPVPRDSIVFTPGKTIEKMRTDTVNNIIIRTVDNFKTDTVKVFQSDPERLYALLSTSEYNKGMALTYKEESGRKDIVTYILMILIVIISFFKFKK